jgi:hypothetical protein
MTKTDKIIELKKLLDSGLINQSDFDRLKSQIFEEEDTKKQEVEVIENDLKNSNKTSEIENFKKDISDSKKYYSQHRSSKYIVFGIIVIAIIVTIVVYNQKNTNDNIKIEDSKSNIDNTNEIPADAPAEPLVQSNVVDSTSNEIEQENIDLKKYIGTYTKQTDLFDSKIVNNELRRILGSEYYNYKDFVSNSACGQIVRKDDLIYGDISIMSVGGYESIFFINLNDKKMHLFWLNDDIDSNDYKIYGDKPIPGIVYNIILEEMNTKWGHRAKFTLVNDKITVNFN